MIERYSRAALREIWSDQSKFLRWLWIERAVLKVLKDQQVIPDREWKALDVGLGKLISKGGVDPKRVSEIEAKTRHDVIAFTTAVAEEVGPSSRYFHYGLTSSDVVDTGLAVAVQQCAPLIMEGVKKCLSVLQRRAAEFKDLPTIGRTHGMYAEPTSFGLKFLGWHQEMARNKTRLTAAFENLRYGKLSGAVGASPHWDLTFEAKALGSLGLKREGVSTQILPRDRFAELMNALALTAAGIERSCLEFRHLQRSEVSELREGFGKGQKGSSAMPHKRNPISSENLTGCARMMRAFANACLENVALWHERDISHSSVERVFLSDSLMLLDYMLDRFEKLVAELEVDRGQVAANLANAGGVVFSGHVLLELVRQGISREVGYRWVQESAHQSIDRGIEFVDAVTAHTEIAGRIGAKRLRELTSLKYQLRHVEKIFRECAKS